MRYLLEKESTVAIPPTTRTERATKAADVLNACKAWTDGTEGGKSNGTSDYYHTVKRPLLGFKLLVKFSTSIAC